MERNYRLDGLEELTGGDRDELKDFVKQFIEDITFSVGNLVAAQPVADMAALKFNLHRAKGAVLTLGVSVLEEPIVFLENNLENSVFDDVCMQKLQFVITTLQNVVAGLKEEFGIG